MNKLLSYAITALLLAFSQMAFAGVGDYYKLVKKVTELKDGDKIVIASREHGVAMGKNATKDNKYREAVSVTFYDDNTLVFNENMDEITLEKGSKKDTYYIHGLNGYIYSDSGTNLKISTEKNKAKVAELKVINNTINNKLVVTYSGTHSISYSKDYTQFGNYADNNALIYKKVDAGAATKDCEISFAQPSVTIDITKSSFDGVELNNPNNLPVTYSISPSGKATIDQSGKITNIPNEETTYTISAIFKGDDTYMSKTVKYTLIVKDLNAEFSQIVFDSNVDKGTSKDQFNEDEISKNGVRMHSSSASFIYNDYSFYMNSSTTFTSSVGDIVKIEFVSSNNGEKYNLNHLNLTTKNGTYTPDSEDHAVWTGKAQTVVFKAREKARATKVIVTVDNRSFKSFTFNELEPNVIETAPYANVTLIRPLSANNWNTICLPFNISQEQIAESFGAKTKVVKFDQVGADNTVKFVSATTIEAGVPYLIKPTAVAPTDGYKFYNVSVTATESKVEGNDGEIKFVGLLAAKDITEGGRVTAAGVTSGGKIAMAKSGTTMKPFRAYFVFPSVQAVESCRIMVDGEETDIKIVTDDSSLTTTDTYTIGGQRVDGDNLDKGVYIRGGRKFVVRK